MALIVEDGSGLSTAESYISVADIATYLTSYKSATELAVWTALTTAEQEAAARVATQYLDSSYRGSWKGSRANEDQALAWPRYSVEDADGWILASDELPARLEQATAEAAFRHANGDTLLADEASGENVRSESASIGSISESKTYAGVKTTSKQFPLIVRMLADLSDGGPNGFGSRQMERA